jgi:uncharacterized protein YjbI with pentapeptide repeats
MTTEDELTALLHSLEETLKSLQRSLYALRDSQRDHLLADLINRQGPLWLAGLDLTRANLSYADLSEAILISTNLERANLEGANLPRANLSGANLRHARLRGADLSEANLSGSDLSGADLEGVRGLEKATLKDTIMPNGSWHA